MSVEVFKAALSELYQEEIAGESSFNPLLKCFTTSRQQSVQLETETKARLRPVVLELGLSLQEFEESRQAGAGLGSAVDGLEWREAMEKLAELIGPFVERYQEIADLAPPEYNELARSMATHELSLQRLAEMEAADKDGSLDDVIKQLIFPLPEPA